MTAQTAEEKKDYDVVHHAISREIANGPARYTFARHSERVGDGTGVDEVATAAWNLCGSLISSTSDGEKTRHALPEKGSLPPIRVD